MRIVKSSIADAEKLTELAIRSKAHWNYTKEQIESWREDLTITEKHILEKSVYQLVDNEQCIGFYSFHKLSDTKVKLGFFFINPDCIGQGFGKVLINNFFEKIRNLKFQIIQVDSDPNAEKFYAKFDFKVVGQMPTSIKNRFLPIMEKQIR